MKNVQTHPLRIARLNLPRPLTQQQLADFAAVSVSTIERAERGEPISIDSIQRICEYFGKDARELGLTKEKASGSNHHLKQQAAVSLKSEERDDCFSFGELQTT